MSIEVSVAIVIKENSAEGAMVSVMESETLSIQSIPAGTRDQDLAKMIWDQVWSQVGIRAAVMADEVKSKTLDQVRVHHERILDGTHPSLH